MAASFEKMTTKAAIRISGATFDGPVGKHLERNPEGTAVIKTPLLDQRRNPATLVNRSFYSAKEAFDYILSCGPETMLFGGTYAAEQMSATVVPKYVLEQAHRAFAPDDMPEFVTATGENLAFREGPGILVIDIDKPKPAADGTPVWPSEQPLLSTPDEAKEAVLSVLSEATVCPILIMPSASSMIVDEATGKELSGPGGWHIHMVIADASQIPRILKLIEMRAWAKGFHCHARISSGGSLLFRSLADQAMARPPQPNYLVADLGPGLARARGGIKIYNADGPYFDPATAVLSSEDKIAAATRMSEARAALKPAAVKIRTQRKAKDVTAAVARGVPRQAAERAAERKVEDSVLLGSDVVTFADGEQVTVARLLGPEGAAYDGFLCLDPLEPDYDGGRTVGKFYWNNGLNPIVHSLAHGAHSFTLRHDDVTATTALVAAGADSHRLASVLAMADLDPVTETQLKRAAAKTLGLGNNLKPFRSLVEDHRHRMADQAARLSPHDKTGVTDYEITPLDQPLERSTFPRVSVTSKGLAVILDHQDNFEHMLNAYALAIRYNVITKSIEPSHATRAFYGDNADMALHSLLLSLCSLNGVPKDNLGTHMIWLANKNAYNPATDYFRTLVWDDKLRLDQLADAMDASDRAVARVAVRIFALQLCAAADHAQTAIALHPDYRPHFESVLVFVGGQGIGKTNGARKLLPAPLRRYHKEGLVLDTTNKDTVKPAISTLMCELGELDSTFRKSDIAALKAFLSKETDEIRMPYAPKASQFERRTVFIGTVNDVEFLADPTGNRRFLPLSVTKVDPGWSDAEIEQVWAEAWRRYSSGEKWWATAEEEFLLAENAEQYRARSPFEDHLDDRYQWGQPPPPGSWRTRATSIFQSISGYSETAHPKTQDIKALNATLRRMWAANGAVVRNGSLMVQAEDGGWVKVYSPGGKNPGWLMPPDRVSPLAAAYAVASEATTNVTPLRPKV